MLIVLIVAVSVSIVVSGICSLMEACLYAVPLAFVKNEEDSGSKSGKLLAKFKNDIGKPIAAILIFNTVAHTVGASVAGWAAGEVFGSNQLILFSIVFTVAILYLSEILPKLIGVVYCRPASKLIAVPLNIMIKLAYPLIVLSDLISSKIKGKENKHSFSHEEILGIASIGTEEGALDHLEGSVIANVIGLDDILIKEVLTPRVVVFRLEENTKIESLSDSISGWNFSRVPIFAENKPEILERYVTQRDIYRELLKGNGKQKLIDISRELPTVPELMRADKLLLQMFEKREHICSVVDEHGSLAGIITMEDIIEEIVGREIVDEYDQVSDMRTFAKILQLTKHRKKK